MTATAVCAIVAVSARTYQDQRAYRVPSAGRSASNRPAQRQEFSRGNPAARPRKNKRCVVDAIAHDPRVVEQHTVTIATDRQGNALRTTRRFASGELANPPCSLPRQLLNVLAVALALV